MSALPGDPTFNQFNNHYDVASYKRIAPSVGLIHRAIFALQSEKTMGLEIYTSILKAQQKQNTAIQTG